MGIISGLLAMFGWGISDFLGAISSRKIGHQLTLFWMQVAGFLIALVFFLLNFEKFDLGQTGKFIIPLAICGLLDAVAYLAFFKGFKDGQISLVSPIGSSWPVLTLILSLVFLKEVLSSLQTAAIILIFLGIIFTSVNLKNFQWNNFVASKGIKEGLVAMIAWGLMFFILSAPSRSLGWFLPVLIFRLFTILFLLPILFFARSSFKMNFKSSSFLLILLVGIIDVAAFFMYSFGIQGEQVSIVASMIAAFPAVTVLLARVFLKETMALNQFFGIIGIIAGLIMIAV